ncbi:glycosyltransferase family 2 protein [Acinetobacter parvus]|uniref:glycosyltransferase family 2 protein n=1 Tax=Acinetobacter parvus TaxID=134533 RepID=UPI003918ABA6
MIKISIITINFNNAAGLKKTLESIKNLKCPDGIELESIVVDGASRDNSVDVIKSYSDTVTRYVSEPDKGIYDAMNKGIRMASGQWLNFMNSGDCFVSSDILFKLNNEFKSSDKTIKLFLGGNMKSGFVSPSHPISIAKKGIIPGCHQSMFFKNQGCLYNISYKIYSDFDYFLEYYLKDPNSIKQINLIISESEPDGIGSQVSITKRKDKLSIMCSRFGVWHTALVYLELVFLRLINLIMCKV